MGNSFRATPRGFETRRPPVDAFCPLNDSIVSLFDLELTGLNDTQRTIRAYGHGGNAQYRLLSTRLFHKYCGLFGHAVEVKANTEDESPQSQ
jgi:hypothetical protein